MSINSKRIIKAGWTGFKRNNGLSFATVFIMVMVISVITALFLGQKTVNYVVAGLKERVDMSVYFLGEPSQDEIADIQGQLSAMPEIEKLEYISKEDALARFTLRHEGDQVIMDSLTELGANPLLASLAIKAQNVDQYAAIASFLESSSFNGLISKIDYYQKKPAIERVFSLATSFNIFGIIFSLALAAFAVLISFNTVRLAIHNSKDEIETMRLVGAHNRFITGPFLVQGVIAGAIAVVITLIIFAIGVWLINSKLNILIPGLGLANFFFSNILIILLLQLVTGVGLGVLSSWLAIRKYLKI
jgi:cell division transport system permease protein